MNFQDKLAQFKAVATKVLAVFSLAVTLLITNTSPSQAFFWLADPNVQDQLEHYFECKSLIFTDPEEHLRLCGPFPETAGQEPIETLHCHGCGPAQQTKPKPKPKPKPEPEPEPESEPESPCEGEGDICEEVPL